MNWLAEHGMQILLWGFTAIALMGSYYNATMRCKLSYALWFLSNFFFSWHNFCIGEIQQCVLYIFLLLTSIVGFRNTMRQKGWLLRASIDKA
jgi:hypothetical protein